MLSLQFGEPIAFIGDSNKMLYLVDPDSEKAKNKLKKKKITKCCKYHNNLYCKKKECCNICPLYYEDTVEDKSELGFKNYTTTSTLSPIEGISKRFISYISGPSGSGKSTMAALIAKEYNKLFPHKKLFIFSRTDAKKDPAFKDLRIKQINIDQELLDNPIDITTEVNKNGVCIIFDDVSTIHDEKLKKEVEKLICDAMEVGRKLDCNIILTNHLVIPNERKFARTLFNELTSWTFFPKSGSSQQITYALKTYWGLSKTQIQKILELDSRWVKISKGYPNYILYANGAHVL